jgi:hypothetical protein
MGLLVEFLTSCYAERFEILAKVNMKIGILWDIADMTPDIVWWICGNVAAEPAPSLFRVLP